MKKRQAIFILILLLLFVFVLFMPAQAAPMNAPQPPGTVQMVGCWSMDETSGTRFDSSPNRYNLLDGNTVGSSAGHVGNSAEFITANREYLSHASNADLTGGNTDLYWAGWVYNVPGMVNYGSVISKSTVTGHEYLLYFDANNLGGLYINSGAQPVTTYLSNYTWYFIEAKYDNAGHVAGLAINNSPWITAASPTDITGTVGEFWIGGSLAAGGAYFWNGRIDEVVMYRRILSDDERAWLYNYGDGRSCANDVVATATATPSATPAITATPTSSIFPPIYTATSVSNTATPTQTANAITQIAANTATAASVGTANAATTTAIAAAATATATPAGSAAITSNAAPIAISIITVPAIISLNESNTNTNETSGGTSSGAASPAAIPAGSFSAVTPVPWTGQGGVAVFGGLSCGGYYIRARAYVDDNQDGMMSPAEGITGLQVFFLDQTYARLGSTYTVDGKAEFCIPVTYYGKTILIDIPYLQLFGTVQVPDQPNQDLEIWFPGEPPTLPLFLP